MPHIEIYHFPNSMSDSDRSTLADEVTEVIAAHFPTKPGKVSIHLNSIDERDWEEAVVEKMLIPQRSTLIREPDYLA
ncbi:tautomerase family protein [Corynebacterium pseudodiphtheriticum]|uniref:tautomerase family protein n=1 Tax=Corynebacterium pseudodiphtheriticum TaxID=37637 RepID=UPI00254C65CF|nr:tautomerase family protein [Corynebacterium pseudodiphtheriticum]MDK8545545.1 tautomerase family protein [Corynebacterium pseudodiphtheriticum]